MDDGVQVELKNGEAICTQCQKVFRKRDMIFTEQGLHVTHVPSANLHTLGLQP